MRPLRRLALLLPLAVLAGGACAARTPEADGARALARVERQVAAGPRIPGTPGHDSIATWIAGEVTRLGGRLERQSFTDSVSGRRYALTNLIGHFGPATGRRIALCAHWDSRPWSDRDPDPAHQADPLPGANDGGSGVAVLLEVAERMAKQPPPVGVDLVFFDGEDEGRASEPQEFCLGSRHYAASFRSVGESERPVAAFLFDMVGGKTARFTPDYQSSQRAANLVEMIAEATRATRARHFGTEVTHDLFDDHIPLLDAGIPAADIIDIDYPAWHTHLDLPDQLSAETLAEVSSVALWLVYRSPLATGR